MYSSVDILGLISSSKKHKTKTKKEKMKNKSKKKKEVFPHLKYKHQDFFPLLHNLPFSP
jgi:hypothetical protein